MQSQLYADEEMEKIRIQNINTDRKWYSNLIILIVSYIFYYVGVIAIVMLFFIVKWSLIIMRDIIFFEYGYYYKEVWGHIEEAVCYVSEQCECLR